MDNLLEKIKEAADYLKGKGYGNASVGVILGTGLGAFIDQMSVEQSIPYDQIPHFPVATVEFHSGKLILGKVGNVKVIAMLGRFQHAADHFSSQGDERTRSERSFVK